MSNENILVPARRLGYHAGLLQAGLKTTMQARMPEDLEVNEIRDYLRRAPKRSHFNGFEMVYSTASRYKWLSDIAFGTIHERINRRAGIAGEWKPWKSPPEWGAKKRHHRNELRKKGLKAVNP